MGIEVGKLAGATLRLAAVLHCVEHGLTGEVGTETLAAAVGVPGRQRFRAEATLNLMRADEGASGASDGLYVLRWIQRHGKRVFTKSEAQQHGKRRFPRAEDIDPQSTNWRGRDTSGSNPRRRAARGGPEPNL